MRPSSCFALDLAWVAFAVALVLAWRKMLAVPDGRGDVTGLFVATVCRAARLGLLGAWLSSYESRRR